MPLIWPALSSTNVYTGLPAMATCRVPSGRLITASRPTPADAAVGVAEAIVSGFQNDSHASTHLTLPSASMSDAYSALPLESTSTSPTPSIGITPTVLPAPAEDSEELPPPHAASASDATT